MRTAHDGQSALKAAHGYRPQLALLGIGLPGLDGYELARRLRRELGGGVRLVAMMGYGRAEDCRRAGAVGCRQDSGRTRRAPREGFGRDKHSCVILVVTLPSPGDRANEMNKRVLLPVLLIVTPVAACGLCLWDFFRLAGREIGVVDIGGGRVVTI